MSVWTDITWQRLNVSLNWHHVTAAEQSQLVTSRDSSWMSVWTDITWQQLNSLNPWHHVTSAEQSQLVTADACPSELTSRDSNWTVWTRDITWQQLNALIQIPIFRLATICTHAAILVTNSRRCSLYEHSLHLRSTPASLPTRQCLRQQRNTHLCFVSGTVLAARTYCLTSILITSITFRSLRWVLLHS